MTVGSKQTTSEVFVRKDLRGRLAIAALTMALAGCAPKGPAYERPAAPSAPAWNTPAPWRPSDPKDAIPKGDWWTIFHDDELSGLVKAAMTANQTLEAARDQYQQSRALTALSLSAQYPHVAI